MITIERSSNRPVHEQLVEQLRYRIATGHFKVDTTLPSTRAFGSRLGISFHTVRKAYQQLEKEGLVEARVGSGYIVRERPAVDKGAQMEQGAAIVQEALQRLIGLGLAEEEMEYLFQEQMGLIEGENTVRKILVAARYQELAQTCAHQFAGALQCPVEGVRLDALNRHLDADFVLAPFPDLHLAREAVPRAEVTGFQVFLGPDVLERIAGLHRHHTLGLVTRHPDAIAPLTQEIKRESGFTGQLIAASVEAGSAQLETFLPQTDLVLYTPSSRRKLRPYLDETRPHAVLNHLVSEASVRQVRQVIPG